MGILNVTPDSFADGGRYSTTELALKRAEEMIAKASRLLMLAANPLNQEQIASLKPRKSLG